MNEPSELEIRFQIPPKGSRKAKTELNAERHSGTHSNNRWHSSGPGNILGFFCVLHSVFYSQRHFLFRYFLPSSWTSRQQRYRRWHLLVWGPVFHRWREWLHLPPLRTGWCSIRGSRKSPPPRADLAHLVVVGDGCFAQLPFKVQLEGKIQVPLRGEEERGFSEEGRGT